MRKLSKILRAGCLLALALALLCNLYVLGARTLLGQPQPAVFGYSSAAVLSGSMSGSIEVNDVVIIHREQSYAPGDVITYQSGSSLITHRLMEETPEGYLTKGDANNAPDQRPVAPEQVVGKVVLVIPRLGALITWLRSPLGLCILTVLAFALLLQPKEQIQKGGEEYEALP